MKAINKVFKIIKKIIITILALIYFSFVLAMSMLLLNYNKYGVTEFNGTSLIILKEDVNNEKYEKGDLLLIQYKDIKNIQIGDEIFVYRIRDNKDVAIDFGKIGNVSVEDNAIEFENGATFDMQFAIGEVDEVHEDIGTYLSFIQSKWVFFFIIVVPCFLIFIYEIYELVVEIKYGSDEEED